jgi:hypothetical protein
MIKEMETVFHEISSAMARFEKVEPNSLHFLKVQRGFGERLTCFSEIYEEKMAIVLLSQ